MGGLKLLLDTHVLLWMLSEPDKLSVGSRAALESMDSELMLSTVSLFEVALKVRLGKLASPGPLLKQTEWTLSKLKVDLLPLSGPAAVLAGQLDVSHRDPFDRLLAAQAMVSKSTLVSSDLAFKQFVDLDTLW